MQMKLLTLNCHSWHEENQLAKIRTLAETIKEHSYDVIALQEVSQSLEQPQVNETYKSDHFVPLLLEELQQLDAAMYHSIWAFNHYCKGGTYEEGVAILTKHPIVNTHTFFTTKSQDPTEKNTRKAVGATISIDGKKYDFYSCHQGWWHDETEPFPDQFQRLLNNIPNERPCFLMGDFNNNAHIRNEGYDYMINNGMLDTYSLAIEKDNGITVQRSIAGWDNNNHHLRIDLILTNQPTNVLQSKVIFNGTNKPIISDHYGVHVEIKN